MKIIVDRYLSDLNATLSRVRVYEDFGKALYACYGLEDEFREIKVPGETRIPAGEYEVTLRKEGGFYERYKRDRRVSDIHEGMLWVRNVPNFEYILIHIGNYETDTDGCLLVGAARDENRMCVFRSVEAYRSLYSLVLPSAKQGRLRIEFQDNDRQQGLGL